VFYGRGNVQNVLKKQSRNEQWDHANSADCEHAVGGRFVWTGRGRSSGSGTQPIAGAGGVGSVRAIQTDGISLEKYIICECHMRDMNARNVKRRDLNSGAKMAKTESHTVKPASVWPDDSLLLMTPTPPSPHVL